MDEESLATEIATIVEDYWCAPTAREVISFAQACQELSEWMTDGNRLSFLAGLRDALNVSYWGLPRMLASLAPVVLDTYDDPRSGWRWLDVQGRDSSQHRLLDLAATTFALPVAHRIDTDGDDYVYADDAIFTGRQLDQRVQRLCMEIIQLPRRPRRLRIFHLANYLHPSTTVLNSIASNLGRLDVSVEWRWGATTATSRRVPDGPGSLLRPMRPDGANPGIRYTNSRSPLRALAAAPGLWRTEDIQPDALFSTPDNRDLVERVLLDVGAKLKLTTKKDTANLRPMGMVSNIRQPTLGFGTMFCTSHNCPNNAPLALWWSVPGNPNRWTPLMKRRV